MLEEVFRKKKKTVGHSRRMDETYIKIKGAWHYLYRAVDKENNTIDFLLTEKRDKKAAKRFFDKAIENNGVPAKITILFLPNPGGNILLPGCLIFRPVGHSEPTKIFATEPKYVMHSSHSIQKTNKASYRYIFKQSTKSIPINILIKNQLVKTFF
jgi:hypothetical protein